MLLPRAFPTGARTHLSRSPIQLLKPTLHLPTRTNLIRLPPQHLRLQTTKPPPRKPTYTYPEKLNIFSTSLGSLYLVGLTRITSICILACGLIWAPSYIFFDPHTPNYLIPVFAVGSAVPIVVLMLTGGLYVHHINIYLPGVARRGKGELMRWAEHVPPNTRLQVKSLWFPWVKTREMEIRDLRRLPRSWWRATNLEQVPHYSAETKREAERYPGWSWVARSWVGRYFVARGQVRDRSLVPGVWERLWEQIPMVGEEWVEGERKLERKTVAAAKMPARTVSRTGKKPPPPPKARP